MPVGQLAGALPSHGGAVIAPFPAVSADRSAGRQCGCHGEKNPGSSERKNTFRYAMAICWTRSNPALRDAVRHAAPPIVAGTGWRPLPQGEGLGSVVSLENDASRTECAPLVCFGRSPGCCPGDVQLQGVGGIGS